MADPPPNGTPTPLYAGASSTPVPDPTTLTNELVSKANASLREVLEAKIEGNAALVKGRFEAADKAITLLEKWRDALPAEIRAENEHLRSLLGQKIEKLSEVTEQQFKGVQTKFSDAEKRQELLSIADKTAIAAALQAQKEAAGATNESNALALAKMENNFAKLIEQTQQLLQAVSRNTDDKINDVKSRLDKGEGRSSVADPSTIEVLRQLSGTVAELKAGSNTNAGRSSGMGDVVGWIFGGVGVLVGIGSLIALAIKLGGEMVEKLIHAPIAICLVAICVYLVIWVIGVLGIAIPHVIVQLIIVIGVLAALLYLYRLFKPLF